MGDGLIFCFKTQNKYNSAFKKRLATQPLNQTSDAALQKRPIKMTLSKAAPGAASRCLVVVAEEAEFGHFFAELAEEVGDVFGVYAAGEIQIEQVLKVASLCRARFYFCQVQSERIKAAEQVVERALDVRQRETQADFVRVGRNVELLGDYDKARGVVGVVLKPLSRICRPYSRAALGEQIAATLSRFSFAASRAATAVFAFGTGVRLWEAM